MSEYPECAMLDDLTAQPRYVMFSLVPPTFSSAFGRQMDSSVFGHQLKTVPMVHGSEQGLGESQSVLRGRFPTFLRSISLNLTHMHLLRPLSPLRASIDRQGALRAAATGSAQEAAAAAACTH